MIEFIKYLEGWRTYICVLIMLLCGILKYFGIIDIELYTTIISILGPLALAAIKSSNNKVIKEFKKTQDMIKNFNRP